MKKTESKKLLPAGIFFIAVSASLVTIWLINCPIIDYIKLYNFPFKFNSAVTLPVFMTFSAGTVLACVLVIKCFKKNLHEVPDRSVSNNENLDERFHTALEHMTEGCQIIDHDFRYVYINKAAALHGRYQPSELIGKTMIEMYPGIENTDMFSILRHCMMTGESSRMENEFTNNDGSKSWFDLFFQPVSEGIFILSLDITDRKNMERDRQKFYNELEQKVKDRTAMLKTANEELEKEIHERKRFQDEIEKSNRELSVLYRINCAAAESLNLESMLYNTLNSTLDILNIESGGIYLVDHITGTMILRVHRGHSDDFVKSIQQIKIGEGISGRAVAEKKPIVIDVSDYPTERLSPLVIHEGFQTIASFPLLSAGIALGAFNMGTRRIRAFPPGEMELLISIGQQLGNTVRNAQLYSSLQQRTAELETANRELEAFSYSVSHDLRAPLRAIDGFSRFLIEDYGETLDSEGRRFLNVIRSNTQKMDHLITGLLSLSKLTRSELTLSALDMNSIADSIFHEIITGEDSRKFRFKIDMLPATYGDAALIRQVWYNLLSNAVKYTSPKVHREIHVGGYDENEYHVYFVKDNGVGFNPEYRHKLFGVFQRLHKSEEFDGTGIGLAIVQRIVNRHGGTVRAEGNPGEGAAFYFSIPGREIIYDKSECS